MYTRRSHVIVASCICVLSSLTWSLGRWPGLAQLHSTLGRGNDVELHVSTQSESTSNTSNALPLIVDLAEFGFHHCLDRVCSFAPYMRNSNDSPEVCFLPFPEWAIACSSSAGCNANTGAVQCSVLAALGNDWGLKCAALARPPPHAVARRTITCPSSVSNNATRRCDFSTSTLDARLADAIIVGHVGTFVERLWRNPRKLHQVVMPAARRIRNQVWALKVMYESTANYEAGSEPSVLRYFNYTFGSDSKNLVGFRMSYLPDWNAILASQSFDSSTASLASQLLKPNSSVVFLTSNCNTIWGREAYVSEFMRYFQVDSWGQCLNNRGFGPATRKRFGLSSTSDIDRPTLSKHDTLSAYKFVIAFENSLVMDYVSEKIFDAWAAGAIPIYYGASNIEDYVPGPNSFIDASGMTPSQLASHLRYLDNNVTAYLEYHEWRKQPAAWTRHRSPLARMVAKHDATDPECEICNRVYDRL